MTMIDHSAVMLLTDPGARAPAINAANLADPNRGFVGAQVYVTKAPCTVYQWSTGQHAHDVYWLTFDPGATPERDQAIVPNGAPGGPVRRRVQAIIPKNTVVVTGSRRDPNSPQGESIPQWYIADTRKGPGNRPPATWRVRLLN